MLVFFGFDRAFTDAPFNQRFCVGAHAYAAGTVDHAIANDGLGEEGEGWRSFVGFYCDSRGHFGIMWKGLDVRLLETKPFSERMWGFSMHQSLGIPKT